MISSTAAAASDARTSVLNRTMFTAWPSASPFAASSAPSRLARDQRAVVGLPAPPLHDERYVDLIGLVVEAQRVHHEVHAHAKRELALALTAGLAGEVVVAEVVARPRAAEVVRDVRGDDPAIAHH